MRSFFAAIVCGLLAIAPATAAEQRLRFVPKERSLEIQVDERPIATYVFQDDTILRPYFAHLRAGNGIQVTRRHPPLAGTDATDHDTMHPGLWLAFGDISGADFWRNKATVQHVEFVEKPSADASGHGSFAVKNRYVSHNRTICEELCRIEIQPGPGGFMILWDSRFTGADDFYFGDQEEMGLGVRVATPMAVKNGGRLINSDALVGEKQVWGKQADWCDYSGVIDAQPVGITLMPDPGNFRQCWFHARDYGFVAANPFGRNAFTKSEKSNVSVAGGESLRLRFAVLIHSGPVDLPSAYKRALAAFASGR